MISCLFTDTAMQILFDGGVLLAWTRKTIVDESMEKKLRASAAIVLANMARNGDRCVPNADFIFFLPNV